MGGIDQAQAPSPVPKAYVPEPVQLEKSILNDLKKKVDTEMGQTMIESILQDEEGEKLRDLVICEPEIEQMQKIVNDKTKSLKEVAEENQ